MVQSLRADLDNRSLVPIKGRLRTTVQSVCSIYTRRGRGIGEEMMRDTCGYHKVLRAAQQLRKMKNKHVCNEEAAW